MREKHRRVASHSRPDRGSNCSTGLVFRCTGQTFRPAEPPARLSRGVCKREKASVGSAQWGQTTSDRSRSLEGPWSNSHFPRLPHLSSRVTGTPDVAKGLPQNTAVQVTCLGSRLPCRDTLPFQSTVWCPLRNVCDIIHAHVLVPSKGLFLHQGLPILGGGRCAFDNFIWMYLSCQFQLLSTGRLCDFLHSF